jgi:methylmalonyl-CoA mutase
VGVNKFRLAKEEKMDVRHIDNTIVREAQIKQLEQVSASLRQPCRLSSRVVASGRSSTTLVRCSTKRRSLRAETRPRPSSVWRT